MSDEWLTKSPRSPEAIDNQILLKDVLSQVIAGKGVPWLVKSSLETLLQDESYRIFLLTRLNAQTQSHENDEYLEHTEIDRSVYYGMLDVLRLCFDGLEHVFNLGICTTAGSGGLASTALMLEIAMTHYYVRKKNNISTSSSRLTQVSASTSRTLFKDTTG